jgi:hypothetical protein
MSDVYPTGQGARVPQTQPRNIDERSVQVIGGGSSVAALCGLGAGVLAIIGLAGLLPVPLSAIGVIAAGAGLLFEGAAVASRFRNIRANIAAAEGHRGEVALETGITAEMVGGIAAIVLGILALIHMMPLKLVPVAAIVFGATMLLGSGSAYETIEMPGPDERNLHTLRMAHRAASSAAGIDMLLGIAAVVLGILAIIGVTGHAIILSLVGVLIVGFAELLTDATLAARMTSIFRHR